MKKTVLAMVVSMLLVGPALAQNQNMKFGGEPQQRNTKMTTTKTMKIGLDGRPYEQEETTNINLINLPKERTNPDSEFKYSGIPCKWYRKSVKAEKAGEGK
jgi:hypothetical protein